MSRIKSFSVGNGDMFYIFHGSDNFSIIDCCITEDEKEDILDEVYSLKTQKGITRFISTHPDEDHILGLEDLDEKINILNFYCVENEATKEDITEDFEKYCELRDDNDKSFYIHESCSRYWMNDSNEERKSSGINILWPKTTNTHFKNELEKVKNGESPNNISPIIKYSLNEGVSVIWMGDLENDFMDKIKDNLDLPEVDILFAPHHGRKSGRVPSEMLDVMKPKIIVVGEASSEDLEYYANYNTITQNTTGDIMFDASSGETDVFVSNENYEADFLNQNNISNYQDNYNDLKYIGTLNH